MTEDLLSKTGFAVRSLDFFRVAEYVATDAIATQRAAYFSPPALECLLECKLLTKLTPTRAVTNVASDCQEAGARVDLGIRQCRYASPLSSCRFSRLGYPVVDKPLELRPLDALEATIRQRAESPSEQSYTSQLLNGPQERLGGKVIEEAAEFVEAAGEPGDTGRQHLIHEAGDLLYHTLVLLRRSGVDLVEVEEELARRFGVSGLEEKSSRSQRSGR